MAKCYICEEMLTLYNESKEHVILNAIGGRLRSKKLLCKACNSEIGNEIDAILAEELHFLSSFMDVKRERNENKPIKHLINNQGETYSLNKGWKPLISKPRIKKTQQGNKVNYSILARNEKELIGILNGIKKNHPDLNIEEAKKKFSWHEEYLTKPLEGNIQVGSQESFRSITKSAINFYILNGGNRDCIKHLIPYIQGKEFFDIASHYYPKSPIYNYSNCNEICHIIFLKGDSKKKLLYAYIEFFSVWSFIVLLNKNYSGKSINKLYCYNLYDQKEIIKNIELDLDLNDFKITKLPVSSILTLQERFNRYFRIVSENHTNKVLEEIIEKSFKSLRETLKTERLTKEQARAYLISDFCLRFSKFYTHINRENE